MRLMYQAACKVEFQPFKRLYSQLTFFNFLQNKTGALSRRSYGKIVDNTNVIIALVAIQ